MTREITYVILKVIDITDSILRASFNSVGAFRISKNGIEACLKFGTPHPDDFAGYIKYDQEQIKRIMATGQWKDDEDPV